MQFTDSKSQQQSPLVAFLATTLLVKFKLNIFFSHRNEDYLQNTLNVELDNVTNWCQANRLSINIKKSKFMIFKPRQKKQNLDISITLTSHAIERVKDIVFLGVILDENLTWKPQIAHVSRKISKSIGVIYKSSF